MWPSALVCALVIAMVAIVASYFVSAASEADVPQYQRRAAYQAACKAAADEISRLRLQSPIMFVDDCLRPKVTPIYNKPGHLIVTRVVEVQIGRATARRTYSALMDGGRIDAWRMIKVESAPNELSVVFSPGALATIEQLAEGSRPRRDQSH
jgi:hypothetical protein